METTPRSSTLDGGRNSFQGLPLRWLEDAPALVVPLQMAMGEFANHLLYNWDDPPKNNMSPRKGPFQNGK